MTVKYDFDVIVIGAGPAGSTAAYSLAKGGLQVGLLDKADFPRDKTCGDGLTPRALKVLEQIGVLGAVADSAYEVRSLTLRYSETITYELSLSGLRGLPHSILIHPRLSLDDLLRRHAVRAGAEFLPEAKVNLVTKNADGAVCVHVYGREPFTCKLAIIATGANTKLLRDVGLLRKAPPVNLAARGYFENVEGLERSIILFFDQVEMPGYGWVFPVTRTSANVGCGVFFDSQTPQATQLRHLIETHPYLKRKGIDYALESGHLAAQAILENWNGNGQAPPSILKAYRTGLRKRFSYQMSFTHLTQKLLFGRRRLGRVMKRAQHSRHIQRVILEACFDSADPAVVFSPQTFWDLLKP
jgi:flavin-dependent dehydrogenase